MEYYIAIATIFNQPCHGLWEGDVECWASEDGGRTWRLRGTPAPHEPGTNCMNVAAGLAANGDLVVIASGWTHRPRKGEGTAGHGGDARPLLPWVCRSSDGGRNCSEPRILQESHHSAGMQWSHSDGGYPASVQLEDGRLVTAWYSSAAPGVHTGPHVRRGGAERRL
jgi:hypothetical protein